MSRNLADGLCGVGLRAPESLALSVAGETLSYGAMARLGAAVAGWLTGRGETRRVGVLAGRSIGAYLGVVGSWWAGCTYIPLGLSWPEERLLVTLGLTGLDALIIDEEAARFLSPRLLAACPEAILLAEPAATGGGRFTALSSLPDRPDLTPVPQPVTHVAYIIFTSGTTGTPKGVQISLGAITHHLRAVQAVYGFTPADRVSLAPDITFDPSILNMLMTWNAGASLHVVPRAQLIAPVDFIRQHQLTVWNSTPATIGGLMRLGWLPPGSLPSLRVSIFGGDTLTLAAASAWQRAAPQSVVDNVYGPTEATIECLHQRLTDPPVVTGTQASLALGLPYDGTEVAILDAERNELPAGEAGELAVGGPQLAVGYLGQPELTEARFPLLRGRRWYLTGDRAYRDSAGRVHHIGRADDQVKVRGYRVELGDVESHLRAVTGTASAAAVAWPITQGAAAGIVGFVAACTAEPMLSAREIRAALELRLPAYMVPQSIRRIDSLPLTPHGKIDRRALLAMLAAEAPPPDSGQSRLRG